MTDDEKFEERVRQIVRDEMEAEWLAVKGYGDQVRKAAFDMCQAIITTQCETIIKSFGPGGAEAPKTDGTP